MMSLHQLLCTALDDEYRARATYQAVVDYYGPVMPFVNIVQAEQRHVAALESLFYRYTLPLPYNRWQGQVPPAVSLQQACVDAVSAEINNYGMYDRLLQDVTQEDVRMVFSNLRNASAYHHLPAFQYCAGMPQAIPPAPVEHDNASPMPLLLGLLAGAGLIWWMSTQAVADQEELFE